MRRFRGRHVVGIVTVAAILAGCGAGKKSADPTTTVASNAVSTATTTKVESVSAICAKLLAQDHTLRRSLSDAIQKLKAARATNPNSADAHTFATERVQIQRVLADVDGLLGRLRKANGPSVCR